MLETLEGRLKWERIPGGIQISIPVRRGTSTAGYALLVLIWLTIASIHYWHLFTQPRLDSPDAIYQLMAVCLYVVGFIFFLGWLAWTSTGETLLSIDSNDMKIQHKAMGIELSSHSYRTN